MRRRLDEVKAKAAAERAAGAQKMPRWSGQAVCGRAEPRHGHHRGEVCDVIRLQIRIAELLAIYVVEVIIKHIILVTGACSLI